MAKHKTAQIIDAEPPTAPSWKSIFDGFGGDVSKEDARLIRRLMKAEFDIMQLDEEDDRFLGLQNRIYDRLYPNIVTPYNYYQWTAAVMFAVDKIIDSYGVEAITGNNDESYGGYYAQIAFVYCNTGDAYSPTVVYYPIGDRFCLTCWGDFMERLERKGWRFK